jgi:hypothetical protein
MQIRGRSVDVVRERPVAKPTSAAGALPAPRARDGKVSLGLAKDIRFDYFKVRNIPAHVGRTRKES